MRAFLAVDLQHSLGSVAHGWGQDVARALGPRRAAGLTWVPPSRVHVTLRFFADLPGPEVDAVIQALAGSVALAEFDLALGGPGTFPERGHPRVLWLGFSQGSRELEGLQGWAQASLAAVAPPDRRESFSPHLTIARIRRDAAPGLGPALREAAAGARAPHGVARVGSMVLIESVPSPKGPTYRPVAEFPLKPS